MNHKPPNIEPPRLPRCFVVQEPTKWSVDDAYDFGEVVALFNPGEITQRMSYGKKFGDIVLTRLIDQQYRPGVDYIILTGALYPIIVTLAVITSFYEGAVKVLNYVGKEIGYEEVELTAHIRDEDIMPTIK